MSQQGQNNELTHWKGRPVDNMTKKDLYAAFNECYQLYLLTATTLENLLAKELHDEPHRGTTGPS